MHKQMHPVPMSELAQVQTNRRLHLFQPLCSYVYAQGQNIHTLSTLIGLASCPTINLNQCYRASLLPVPHALPSLPPLTQPIPQRLGRVGCHSWVGGPDVQYAHNHELCCVVGTQQAEKGGEKTQTNFRPL